MSLNTHSPNLTELDRKLKIRSVLNFENILTICAVGALLSFIMKHRILDQIHNNISLLKINSIQPIPKLQNTHTHTHLIKHTHNIYK